MKVVEFAKDFKMTILELSAEGRKTLKISNIVKYLDEVIENPNQELPEANLTLDFRSLELDHESNLENFKAVIAAGQNAIRTMVLINGAATIAILAFIGNLSVSNQAQITIMAPTLLPFAIGTFLGGVTSGATYLTQWLYANQKTEKFGFAMNIICIIAGLSSFIAFLLGIFKVYFALI